MSRSGGGIGIIELVIGFFIVKWLFFGGDGKEKKTAEIDKPPITETQVQPPIAKALPGTVQLLDMEVLEDTLMDAIKTTDLDWEDPDWQNNIEWE